MTVPQVEDGCPGIQGLEPPAQTQAGRTAQRLALPTTQPQAHPPETCPMHPSH